MMNIATTDVQLTDWRSHALKLEREVKKVIVGQDKAIRLMNVAIFARGHVLLERSEERRVGKECASMCRSRWSPYH